MERLWCTPAGTTLALDSYTSTLPLHVKRKNNISVCEWQDDHVTRGELNIASQKHTMRTIYTECTSSRSLKVCESVVAGTDCELNGIASVFVEGIHIMENPAVDSPREAYLYVEMKQYLEIKLPEDSTIFPFMMAFIGGPLPTQEQSSETRSSTDVLIFCDTEECVDNNGHYSPSIEDGYDIQLLRVGLTRYGLLEAYLAVQCGPRPTTVLHVDSIHNTVNTRYFVFILGISDPSDFHGLLLFISKTHTRYCLMFGRYQTGSARAVCRYFLTKLYYDGR
ncbi:Hypothetical protein PHPALM_16906 [Phytophthora palmivora]|uniref:Uncharacterized protein n=1 Tax=Phytophthora palmivora TaxID=4796 RepID=A0A2P4XNM6_9STRA|nr:Hypothetical protein PHPALM_16906 [Phytophthora palmivora]